LGKLRVFSGHDLCDLLASHGFRPIRQKGSHVVLQRTDPTGQVTTVPVPLHKELRVGTLAAIIRQSGLPRKVFESE
jgi:predicted RNA binding protein YcfA (HicA-like mRNA interferase family)